jgi:hypothetical protein
VIFEVLTVMNMKMTVVRVVAPCSLIEFYRHFRGVCCLHRQGDKTSVNVYQTTRRNNPEDTNLRYLHVLLKIISPVACLSIVLLLWITLYESKPFHLLASAFISWISKTGSAGGKALFDRRLGCLCIFVRYFVSIVPFYYIRYKWLVRLYLPDITEHQFAFFCKLLKYIECKHPLNCFRN